MRERVNLPARILSPEVRAAMREIARRDGALAIAEAEAENSLNLKLAARTLGLDPVRILTLGARWINYSGEGHTIGDFLQETVIFDWKFWTCIRILAGMEKDGAQSISQDLGDEG